jgi:hypothetical protein
MMCELIINAHSPKKEVGFGFDKTHRMEINGVHSIYIVVIPVALEGKVLCLLRIINVLHCHSTFN